MLIEKKPAANDEHNHQLWKFTPDGFVQNVATGLVLDVHDDDEGTKVLSALITTMQLILYSASRWLFGKRNQRKILLKSGNIHPLQKYYKMRRPSLFWMYKAQTKQLVRMQS